MENLVFKHLPAYVTSSDPLSFHQDHHCKGTLQRFYMLSLEMPHAFFLSVKLSINNITGCWGSLSELSYFGRNKTKFGFVDQIFEAKDSVIYCTILVEINVRAKDSFSTPLNFGIGCGNFTSRAGLRRWESTRQN